MKITKTKLDGCFIIEPTILKDKRGYFYESFNSKKFNELTGLNINFVQDNQALSSKGVLRGLHYQVGKDAQAKLVRVLKGKVLDVAVDIRKESPTYGEYVSVKLSAKNHKQLFVPRGFAHGYIVLSKTALFFYKCDNFYNKQAEGGIMYNDPTISIDWKLPQSEFIISEKDKVQPSIENAKI
ncbi:dTDP-4-dehydrorhamnose 3,5-epimerase [Urechidicola croceus]|uniref:dTDP-4-dehydrorhamnose 3,5-epimerase n=1 Tax=Urechidicola croceus TaxID=1850246 RepID=A0A1D8P9A1_9FLAO|nr:dTDP-4-dehydrorhamnose 3,5-epimerase [Urechidicola croceus]AOW21151.1 dTDP-4-dehydrorhamnose 3,5-epimerase [Urechidicola croceus]